MIAAGDGRPTIQSEAYLPPGGTAPGEAFAAAMGYSVASRESIKQLDMQEYVARRPGLREAIGGAADGYRFVSFDTVCPDEHVESFGRILGMLITEIPLGELDLESGAWRGSARPSSGRWTSAGTCSPRWRSPPTGRSRACPTCG